MAQVSRYPVRQEVYEQIFTLLLRVVSESRPKEKATHLLDDLLTPTEKIVLAKRLGIALLLAKGYSYEEIEKILRVSKPTIATVNMTLKYKGRGYKSFVEKILREQKFRKAWEKIEDLVLGALSHGKGSGSWRYLHKEIKKKRWKKKTSLSG